jgi:DNA-binding cell septation regulator SpoVG
LHFLIRVIIQDIRVEEFREQKTHVVSFHVWFHHTNWSDENDIAHQMATQARTDLEKTVSKDWEHSQSEQGAYEKQFPVPCWRLLGQTDT